MSFLTPKHFFQCSCPRHTFIPWKIFKNATCRSVLARFIKWDSEIIDTCDMQGRRWDQFFDSKFHKKGWVSCKRHSKSLHWLLNGSNAFLHTNMRFRVTPSQLQKKAAYSKDQLGTSFPWKVVESLHLRICTTNHPGTFPKCPCFFQYQDGSSQPEMRIHCKFFPLSVLQSFEAAKAAKEAPWE